MSRLAKLDRKVPLPAPGVPSQRRSPCPSRRLPRSWGSAGSRSHEGAAFPDATGKVEHPLGMRLWILSDVRADLNPAFSLPDPLPDFDALLVAGGICAGLEASLGWLAAALGGRQGRRPVVMVPGNLEYWSEIPLVEALAKGRRRAVELGIHLLSDETVRLEGPDGRGVHVVGATLWTDWSLEGAFQGKLARVGARHAAPDCDRILLRRGRPWSPLDALAVHARSRAYVEDALTTIAYQSLGYPAPPRALVEGVMPGDRAVVLTCHAPSRRSLPEDWSGWLCDGWVAASLASDLDAVMQAWGAPCLWVHGITPGPVDYRLGRTRIVANPRGDARVPGFDPALVVVA